ncbi:MAG: DUF1566 domain-containing protein [Proteobacteria bacterium]|nr:DUF1566 domain-containing protein [Pseudomonadota bacterium]
MNIFGVTGTVIESSGDAVAGDVLTGKTFSNAGAAGVSGTMASNGAFALSCGVGDQGVTAGYYSGGTLAGDGDLVEGNIMNGVDIFGVTGTATVAAYPAFVPKTGQTTLYRTGDDGDIEKGVAWPGTRFTNNGDGTVTDELTGLMWIQNPDATTRAWDTAVDYCNALTTATYTDWRLPNYLELISLIDISRYSPALPSGHPFSGVQSSYYWSGSTCASVTSSAWYVNLYSGFVGSSDKTGTYYAWPVRGGQ